MHYSQRRGNILFLILLAVVLFAALSYAVTQSLRGGGKDASTEKINTAASALLQYAGTIESALMRMNLTSSYDFDKIDYGSTTSGWNSGTNSACTSNSCKLFNVEGGGIPALDLPAPLKNSATSRTSAIYLAQVKNVGTNLPELGLYIENINEQACREINKIVGLGDIIPIEAGLDGGGSVDFYSSGTLPTIAVHQLGNDDARLAGRTAFCMSWNDPDYDYAFFYVLVSR